MKPQALILLGLLSVCTAFPNAHNDDGGFRCKDGEYTELNKRCNGRSDCSNGMDENPTLCNTLPTVELPVNTTVTARVQHGAHSGILLLLCGERCTKVWLMGTGERGELCHWAWTCDANGGQCTKDFSAPLTSGFGHGELVIGVRRGPRELTVWRADLPGDVVTAAADLAGNATLRVRPHTWDTDMPVHFSDLVAA